MVDVRLRLFIPSRAVLVPFGPAGFSGFDGDNRTFSFADGTARADIWVDVDNSPFTQTPITVKKRAFGQSAMYVVEKLVDVLGKPSWWKAVRKDPFLQIEAPPDAVATATVTDETLSVTGRLEPGPFGLVPNVRVSFHVAATLPLEPLAPPINCDLDVLVSATGTPFVTFSVKGAHDSFPAYELYIQQRRVYSYDPEAAGSTPLGLAAVGNVLVDIPFTALV